MLRRALGAGEPALELQLGGHGSGSVRSLELRWAAWVPLSVRGRRATLVLDSGRAGWRPSDLD